MFGPILSRLAPFIFVLIWSTGWIAAKYAAPHADPLTFLSVRFACAAVVLGLIAAAVRSAVPNDPRLIGHMMLSGVLIHGTYLGGVWWAVAHGLPAGLSALIAALQPLMATALSERLLGERISAIRWAGVALGLVGIVTVLAPKLATINLGSTEVLLLPILVNTAAMLCVTLGTFHQKKQLPSVDLRMLATWQFIGAVAFVLPLALLLEPLRFDLVPETFYALAWSVLILSVVAIALLLMLIRQGSVARVSALIYLVPPTAAVQAWLMFGETLTPVQILGMVVVAAGVYLATRA
jgi:drug/metabolite transporter (DMT)-like permease